ncbi:RtcB family protein [Nitrospina sp. 32_T5]|uniref:RtcB family protein n=1 Tax=unclassified Nitrospina TaxID=2638683 RepID=UPI003F98B50C
MQKKRLNKISETEWWIEPTGPMRVPGIIYGTEDLVEGMDDKVHEQVSNVAALPGIQKASYAMPDAHWGYGFPIGGVAAFDPDEGGVISAGGVGFDISCGVRTLHTGLVRDDIERVKETLADLLYTNIPAGVGSRGAISLDPEQMDAMLEGGAQWAVGLGWGRAEDLKAIEEEGCMQGADANCVSPQAKKRQKDEMGTLGSGNHYLELQEVIDVYDADAAKAFGLREGDIVISIHCGSRGLGHQIGTEFLKSMAIAAPGHGIQLPDRELACAPINSELGQQYLGAMRSAMNCAMANRQIITHLVRETFEHVLPKAELDLLYDVSHNTCKMEQHQIDGKTKTVFVHRKGATRSFGPGHPDISEAFRKVGQPVLIGGTMGTASYVLCGTDRTMGLSFGSAVHGAGRQMSRRQATKLWKGRAVIDDLAMRGILIRSPSQRGVAEEAPGAYKDVSQVVEAAHTAGLARKVARVEPIVCVKG